MLGFFTDRKIRALREDLDRLEGRFKGLETEWNDVYDKVTRMMQRVVKRHAMLVRAEEAEAAGSDGAGSPEVVPRAPSPMTAGLSERQREIQQQILKRRAGG